jgi:acetyl-CoA C-acetyltransferase
MIWIVGAARTPMGGFQGELASCTASALGGQAIAAALARSGVAADSVQDVLMGCVLPAGQGQAPARQAALAAGLPVSVPCTTVNKMCGSGMRTVMMGFDALKAGSADVVVAGGMESMSNAPYLLPKARGGMRMGHGQVMDHMFLDGLEDAYEKGRLMGTFAEDCAGQMNISRERQDGFALESLRRALQAAESGHFDWEIAPVKVGEGDRAVTVLRDEQPVRARPDKIPTLKPAFRTGGTVTAANSSSISDGAAALVLVSEEYGQRKGLKPIAKLLGCASHARKPSEFTVAPAGAIEALLGKLSWSVDSVDAWEINEAFAVVTLAAIDMLKLPAERVNVHGGACALGHPIGASGARIIVSLMGALQRLGKQRGVASLCIGGGEATAIALEMCQP